MIQNSEKYSFYAALVLGIIQIPFMINGFWFNWIVFFIAIFVMKSILR